MSSPERLWDAAEVNVKHPEPSWALGRKFFSNTKYNNTLQYLSNTLWVNGLFMYSEITTLKWYFQANRTSLWAPSVIPVDFMEKKKYILLFFFLQLLVLNRYVPDRKMQEGILEWIKQNWLFRSLFYSIINHIYIYFGCVYFYLDCNQSSSLLKFCLLL